MACRASEDAVGSHSPSWVEEHHTSRAAAVGRMPTHNGHVARNKAITARQVDLRQVLRLCSKKSYYP